MDFGGGRGAASAGLNQGGGVPSSYSSQEWLPCCEWHNSQLYYNSCDNQGSCIRTVLYGLGSIGLDLIVHKRIHTQQECQLALCGDLWKNVWSTGMESCPAQHLTRTRFTETGCSTGPKITGPTVISHTAPPSSCCLTRHTLE